MKLEKDLAEIAGGTKTGAVHKGADERFEQVAPGDRRGEAMRCLEQDVWPKVPSELLGRGLSKEEQEELLGYGPEGV